MAEQTLRDQLGEGAAGCCFARTKTTPLSLPTSLPSSSSSLDLELPHWEPVTSLWEGGMGNEIHKELGHL